MLLHPDHASSGWTPRLATASFAPLNAGHGEDVVFGEGPLKERARTILIGARACSIVDFDPKTKHLGLTAVLLILLLQLMRAIKCKQRSLKISRCFKYSYLSNSVVGADFCERFEDWSDNIFAPIVGGPFLSLHHSE